MMRLKSATTSNEISIRKGQQRLNSHFRSIYLLRDKVSGTGAILCLLPFI